jgi:hypothetical protein
MLRVADELALEGPMTERHARRFICITTLY